MNIHHHAIIQWAIRARISLGLALFIGAIVSLSGCGGDSGGSSGRFVPNDNKIEQINGMSPSEAFHKNDRRRK